MTLEIESILIFNVQEFFMDDCGLSIVFQNNHSYPAIESIEELLNRAYLNVIDYHFNSRDRNGYYSGYGTVVSCEIPKPLRGKLTILIKQ